MRFRFAAAVTFALASAALAAAKPVGTYSKAVPPNKTDLDRLNLRTEWTQFLPVEGTRDALAQVQTLDDQVFVQTRSGMIVALDARTGRIQWSARLGNGDSANAYPVAANDRFVFVAHVTKLYAFYRYTGAVEFAAELGTPVTAGLACDSEGVFCVLGMRPGSAGAHRVAVFNLPPPVVVNEPVKAGGPVDPLLAAARAKATSPVDDLLNRYSPGAVNPPPDSFDPVVRPNVLQTPTGGGAAGSKTPSVSALPSVVPPYSLDQRAPAPSLAAPASLRQPYRLRPEGSRFIQQTPSLSTIPPSIAASMLLADLRPKGVEPKLRWEYGLTARVLYPVILTPTRVWVLTEGEIVLALNKNYDKKVVTEVSDRLVAAVPAAPSASGITHYVPFANGTLAAVDATGGTAAGGVNIKWRADVNGLNDYTPFVSGKHVYAAGDNSGVTCIERATGDVLWQSDKGADRVIGATEELVYVRDRQGRFLVYDAKRATDPERKKSVPLGSANFSEFNVHVVNTASDRVYLAADNGLLVCLRDAGAKYAKPVRVWPPVDVNPPKKTVVEVRDGMEPKKDPDPKTDPDPKKDPDPKMDPKMP